MQSSHDRIVFGPVGSVDVSSAFTLSDSEIGLAHSLLWSIGSIHTDRVHMASTPFGAPLVAGPFLAALAAGIQQSNAASIALEQFLWLEDAHSFTVTYRKPVLAGEAVVVKSTVTAYDAPTAGDGSGLITITDECQTTTAATLLQCIRSHRCRVRVDGGTSVNGASSEMFADRRNSAADAPVSVGARGRTISHGEIVFLRSLARLGQLDEPWSDCAVGGAAIALPNQLTMAIVVSLGSMGPFFASLEHDNDLTTVAALSHSADAFTQVQAGDTILVETSLVSLRESDSRPDHYIVQLCDTAVNQRNEKCMEVTRALLMRRTE